MKPAVHPRKLKVSCLAVKFIPHRLLPFYYPLDVIQLVQRFKRRQVIYVQIQYLITYLAQYRVIKLEEAELHAATRLSHFGHRFA